MKILVLGATGATGKQIVRLALDRGHRVTALVRSTESLAPWRDCMQILQGNVLDHKILRESLQGIDAVLSGFGPRVPIQESDAHLLETFAGVLTRAMVEARVQRALIISTAFLFADSIIPPTRLIGRLFFSGVVSDSQAMERIVSQSPLEWTLIRPPQLTNGPFTGHYRVVEGHLPRFGFKISRADVADAFLNAVENKATIHQVLGVSN